MFGNSDQMEHHENITSISINPDQERMIRELKEHVKRLETKVDYSYGIIKKVYEKDTNGEYMTNGWFVIFHDILETPNGVVLSSPINREYGVKNICFRSRDADPYLGHESDPVLFPKSDKVGFRAMTIWKVPKTGTYDFKVLTDDGMKLFYQKVNTEIIKSERYARNEWTPLIDAWNDQAETWLTSDKLNLNQSDMILLRMDYYENSVFASACIKVRYHESTTSVEETMLPEKDIFCSLVWNHIPILGYS